MNTTVLRYNEKQTTSMQEIINFRWSDKGLNV